MSHVPARTKMSLDRRGQAPEFKERQNGGGKKELQMPVPSKEGFSVIFKLVPRVNLQI